MKTLSLVLVASGLFASSAAFANCGGSDATACVQAPNRKVSFAMPEGGAGAPVVKKGETAVFLVKGMHCPSCESKVTKAIENAGFSASRIAVDHATGRASFECGAKTCDLSTLFKKIDSLGYKAKREAVGG